MDKTEVLNLNSQPQNEVKNQDASDTSKPTNESPSFNDDAVVDYKSNGEIHKVTLSELKRRAAMSDGAERSMQEAAEAKKALETAKKAMSGDWEAEKSFYKFLGMGDNEIREIEAFRMSMAAGPTDNPKEDQTSPEQEPVTRGELLKMEEKRRQEAYQQAGRQVLDNVENLIMQTIDSHPQKDKITRQYETVKNNKGRDRFFNRWTNEAQELAQSILLEKLNRGEPLDLKRIREATNKAVEETFSDLSGTWIIGNPTLNPLGRAPDTSGLEDFGQIESPKLPKPLGQVSEEDFREYMVRTLKSELRKNNENELV